MFINCTCLGSRLESSSQRVCRVLKTVRLLQFLHLMSCRNLLGLPERRPIIPDGLEKESGIPCTDPGGNGWFGRVAAQSPLAKGTSNEFSEASRRTIKELGNIELYDLGEISQTVQCTTCLKYSKEGAFHCTCGVCLVLSPEQTEDRDTDLNNGRMITGKQKTQKENSEEVTTRLHGAPITY